MLAGGALEGPGPIRLQLPLHRGENWLVCALGSLCSWLFPTGPRLHQCLWRVSEAGPGGWALALYPMSKTPGVSSF